MLISEKFFSKIKKVKFEKKIAIKKVNQSVNRFMFTVTFLMYDATNEITR